MRLSLAFNDAETIPVTKGIPRTEASSPRHIGCLLAPLQPAPARQSGLRAVSSEEGHELARRHGCLFVETSAKGNVAVGQAFEELLCKVGRVVALRTMEALGRRVLLLP